MASLRLQMLGSTLALFGWIGTLLTCLMPMWRVTAFIGTTIVTSEVMWEGIWMTCTIQSTGYIQCNPYKSTLALGTDLKAAQVLTVGSILTGTLGLILAFIGGKCTRFLYYREDTTKARTATAAGITLIIAGILCLIPVSWTSIAMAQAFYNPQMIDIQRRELGAAIYLGCGASTLLLLGGGLLCSTCCSVKAENHSPSVQYMTVRSSHAGSGKASTQHLLSVKSGQMGAQSVRSQWSKGESAYQQKDGPGYAGSEQSKLSTTKFQLAKEKSTVESEQREELSTNSQRISTSSYSSY